MRFEELKENVPCYKDYTLEEGQTIIDWLKIELGVTESSEDNAEEEISDEEKILELEKSIENE